MAHPTWHYGRRLVPSLTSFLRAHVRHCQVFVEMPHLVLEHTPMGPPIRIVEQDRSRRRANAGSTSERHHSSISIRFVDRALTWINATSGSLWLTQDCLAVKRPLELIPENISAQVPAGAGAIALPAPCRIRAIWPPPAGFECSCVSRPCRCGNSCK